MGDWFFFGGGNRRKTGHGTNVSSYRRAIRLFIQIEKGEGKNKREIYSTHTNAHVYICDE